MSILIHTATAIAIDEEHGATRFSGDIRVGDDRIEAGAPALPVGEEVDEAAVLAETALRAPEYLAERDRAGAVAREHEPYMRALSMPRREQATATAHAKVVRA